ncbi:hypothetical protein KKH23_10260 [Patescibacteria group bacterium]|nr:hypothetical protein [Patescibacteria group bacterium]MBU0847556.1 hypothetical protein [Patescibacteria group bacterium]
MPEHECKLSLMVWSTKPSVNGGGRVSFKVTCRICGKTFDEVYTRNDGLWDPATGEYVFLAM